VTLSPEQPIKGSPAVLEGVGTVSAAVTDGASQLTVQLDGVSNPLPSRVVSGLPTLLAA